MVACRASIRASRIVQKVAGLTPGPSRTALTKARQHNGSGLELPKGRAPQGQRLDEIRAGRPDGRQTTASMFPASSRKKGIISLGSINPDSPDGSARILLGARDFLAVSAS